MPAVSARKAVPLAAPPSAAALAPAPAPAPESPTVLGKRQRDDEASGFQPTVRRVLSNDDERLVLAMHPQYEGYGATQDGRAWSLRKTAAYAREVGSVEASSGRWRICIPGTTIVQVNVYRNNLVHECWLGAFDRSLQVDHIDNNKQNDALDNLQLLTYQEHILKTQADNPEMITNGAAKRQIPVIGRRGTIQAWWPSQQEAADYIGDNTGNVCTAIKHNATHARKRSCKGWVLEICLPAAWKDLPGEEWRPLAMEGAERIHVSSLGRVRFSDLRVTVGTLSSNHLSILFKVEGQSVKRNAQVHRLVAQTFLGPAPPGMTNVYHRNADVLDNRVTNLVYGNSITRPRHNARPLIIHNSTMGATQQFNTQEQAAAAMHLSRYSLSTLMRDAHDQVRTFGVFSVRFGSLAATTS
jgi:hypothetical protein